MKKTDPQNTANNAKAVVRKVWIWRAPAGLLRYKQRFETKASSAPVSGNYWTSGTVITLHGSDNRGGITVKTCTDTCSHKNKKFLDRNVQVSVIGIVVCLYTTCGFELSKNKTNRQTKTTTKNNNNNKNEKKSCVRFVANHLSYTGTKINCNRKQTCVYRI